MSACTCEEKKKNGWGDESARPAHDQNVGAPAKNQASAALDMNIDAANRYASRAAALRAVGLDACRRSALASLRARTVVKVRGADL